MHGWSCVRLSDMWRRSNRCFGGAICFVRGSGVERWLSAFYYPMVDGFLPNAHIQRRVCVCVGVGLCSMAAIGRVVVWWMSVFRVEKRSGRRQGTPDPRQVCVCVCVWTHWAVVNPNQGVVLMMCIEFISPGVQFCPGKAASEPNDGVHIVFKHRRMGWTTVKK